MTNVDLASADGQDRYVPSATRDIMSAGHEGVYEWVAEHLVKEGMRVLDFGCGTGYGAALLARAGASVDGVDSSPAAITYAMANFGGPSVRFVVADLMRPLPEPCTSLPVPKSSNTSSTHSPSSEGWRIPSTTAGSALSVPRTVSGHSSTRPMDTFSLGLISWSSLPLR